MQCGGDPLERAQLQRAVQIGPFDLADAWLIDAKANPEVLAAQAERFANRPHPPSKGWRGESGTQLGQAVVEIPQIACSDASHTEERSHVVSFCGRKPCVEESRDCVLSTYALPLITGRVPGVVHE